MNPDTQDLEKNRLSMGSLHVSFILDTTNSNMKTPKIFTRTIDI